MVLIGVAPGVYYGWCSELSEGASSLELIQLFLGGLALSLLHMSAAFHCATDDVALRSKLLVAELWHVLGNRLIPSGDEEATGSSLLCGRLLLGEIFTGTELCHQSFLGGIFLFFGPDLLWAGIASASTLPALDLGKSLGLLIDVFILEDGGIFWIKDAGDINLGLVSVTQFHVLDSSGGHVDDHVGVGVLILLVKLQRTQGLNRLRVDHLRSSSPFIRSNEHG